MIIYNYNIVKLLFKISLNYLENIQLKRDKLKQLKWKGKNFYKINNNIACSINEYKTIQLI